MISKATKSATLLICEDDAETRTNLCTRFRLEGFETIGVARGEEALSVIGTTPVEMIVLDISLPDGSGFDVIRKVRRGEPLGTAHHPGVPIVVLSGLGAEADRIRGLRDGADDYLVKPFAFGELLARVENILNRGARAKLNRIEVGDLVVDRVRHTVHIGRRPVELSRKEFDLLAVLGEEPDRVFTKRELLLRVWGFDAVGRTRTLDAHASRLRRKLDPHHSRFVFNVWGVGFKLTDS